MPEIEHPRLAVMFTDIKGYSRMMSEDEARALNVLAEHNSIMESVIAAHGGRVVKKLGDSYMVIFKDSDAAVKCGLHALTKLSARNRQNRTPVEIRLGIHEGAMFERDGDFFGENVNIAARLEQMARPMHIAASERVVQEIATRICADARFDGAQALKNLRYPVSVYQISPSDQWKLYLSADGSAADTEQSDVLGDITHGAAAWQSIEGLVHEGDLNGAARLAEAALSRFGGTYGQYVHLAAYYLVAGLRSEAQSALKMGEMLGQKSPDDAQYDWLQMLITSGEDTPQPQSTDTAECLSRAQEYVAGQPHDLVLRVVFESLKCRLTGHTGGLAELAQQYPNSALVLRGLAEALMDQHREADAYNMLEQAISVAPQVAEHQLRRVQWMVAGDDLDTVLEESAALTRKFPEDPRVYQWTGKVRLLNLDPFGAQWIFEQAQDSSASRRVDSAGWLICSLMHQGRFEKGVERARKEMRHAIRQNRRRRARIYLRLAISGIYLQHWEDVLEILEEYKRYDPDWRLPRAAIVVAKHNRKLIPWERAMSELGELALQAPHELPDPSALPATMMLPAVRDAEHWLMLHQSEFFRKHRDRIVDGGQLDAAAMEARGALLFNTVEPWHLGLVPLFTRLRSRLDHRLPSLLALAGLIEARMNNFEAGRELLEQARKLWRNADWPVWEIQEAESVLASAASRATAH